MAFACSDDTTTTADSAVKTDAAKTEASVTKADGAVDTTGIPGDFNMGDKAHAACPALITWTSNGGMVSYRDTQTLKTCTDFTLTRKNMSSGGKTDSCATTIGGDRDVSSILVALTRKDVKDAFDGTIKFYGYDGRPHDGVAFSVTIAGKTLLIGDDCGTKTACTAIPAGLKTLRTHLRAITASQRKLPACANITP